MSVEIPLEDLTLEQMVRVALSKILTMEIHVANIREALEEQGAEIARVSEAVNVRVAELLQQIEDAQAAWEENEAQLVAQHLVEAYETAESIRINTAALGTILAQADPDDDTVPGEDPTEDPET